MKLDVIYEAYHDGAIEVVEEEAESLVLSEYLEEDSFKFTISIPAHVSKATYYLDNVQLPMKSTLNLNVLSRLLAN